MEFLQAGGKPVPKTLGQYVMLCVQNSGKVRLTEEHETWRIAARDERPEDSRAEKLDLAMK